MANRFTVLFDYDSMVYKAIWKIVDISDIRLWFRDGRSRDWMEREIINLTINRLEQMGNQIFMDIEDTGIEIEGIEYFLTNCPNSRRKAAYPQYKANRKPNRWVNLVRKELIEMDFAATHPEWEADDLIKDRSVELGPMQCIICSVDKDLQQIEGLHFDYYRPRLKNPDGSPVLDENGHRKVAPCRGLKFVTPKEAERFFWVQMLTGDSTDNIPGLRRVGPKTADTILGGGIDYEKAVKVAYMERHESKEDARASYELHKLLIGLGVKHRP